MTKTLAESFDCLLFDLDGVIYRGSHAVRGAITALDECAAARQICVYVTNNASRSAEDVAEHLRSLGITLADADVVTSPQAAVALLPEYVPAGSSILVVGGAGIDSVLVENGYLPVRSMAENPAAVMQGFGPLVTWADLAEAAYAIESGLPWIATNPDLTFPTDRGVAPGNGSLVAAVAHAVGRSPDAMAGKPETPLLVEALRRCGHSHGLMIGDRLDTDVRGGSAAGLSTLLVLTGVHGVAELLGAEGPDVPDYIGVDLGVLHEEYPDLEVQETPNGVKVTCRGAWAQLDERGQVKVGGVGDWIDTVRALVKVASASRFVGREVDVPQALHALAGFTGTVSPETMEPRGDHRA
jgi:HAD superfamily hydrolase (TIGR01450 family)